MKKYKILNNSPLAITIGGANTERILNLSEKQFFIGNKYTVKPVDLLPGGSAIVQASCLLSMGIPVLPIIPIVDDFGGRCIIKSLQHHANKSMDSFFLPDIFLLDDRLKTASSTILITDNAQRTVITENTCIEHCVFIDHFFKLFDRYFSPNFHDKKLPKVAAISHIYSDNAINGSKGEITYEIINYLLKKQFNIFVNFGKSQYLIGHKFWEKLIKQIYCFQLSFNEILSFFGITDSTRLPDLKYIFNWFRSKCNLIITLGNFGSIVQMKNSEIIFHCGSVALDNKEIKDTTGAGNAFLSGIIISSLVEPIRSVDNLLKAIQYGALFGSYICTQMGSAYSCPDYKEINEFKKMHRFEIKPRQISINDVHQLIKA